MLLLKHRIAKLLILSNSTNKNQTINYTALTILGVYYIIDS